MGFVQWAQAENGDIPAWKMVDVDGKGHLLNPAAAAFLHAWDADYFDQTGIHITISEGFRDIATQERLYALWLAGRGNMAAVPHTSSHGMGLAVDVNSWTYGNSSSTANHAKLVDAGHRHGWSWELIGKPSGEAWHFNYTGDPTLISVLDYNAKYGTDGEEDMPLNDADIKKITDALIPAVNNLFKLQPAGEAALNVSSLILTAPVKLDKDGTQALSAVLNEVFYRGRANETAIRAIAAKLGVELPA